MAKSLSCSREPDERRRHIEELKRELEEVVGGPVPVGFSEECPLDIQEKFLEQVLRFERTAPVVLLDELTKCGVEVPPPERLDDALLHAKLWEVLRRLAFLGAYLENTDHLSDRELYEKLWREILREPVVILPDDPTYDCFCDLVGTGRAEDMQFWLKYYADDDMRRRWSEAWPDDPMPERAEKPYDRDRYLPQPSLRTGSG